tara:strand:- start:82 stop:441 length:360 start_codon:yes stop_codon:yes gene_type:complete
MKQSAASTITYRPVFIPPLLLIVTFGLYGLVWFYKTSDELIRYNKQEGNPLAWLIMALIPLLNIFAVFFHAQAVEKFSKRDGREGIGATLIFLMWLFPPLALLFIQAEMNAVAGGKKGS